MNKKKLFFRFDADNSTGTGHLKRCLTLGQHALASGFDVKWITKHIIPEIDTLMPSGKATEKIDPRLSWIEEAEWIIGNFPMEHSAIILDVTTHYSLEKIDELSVFVSRLKTKSKIVIMDGLGDDSISKAMAKSTPDMVIIPYVGAGASSINMDDCRWLLGPKYFVLDKPYRQQIGKEKQITPVAKKILVTFGGSDPEGTTLLVMDALSRVDVSDLEIKIVVGPGFSKELKKSITGKIGASAHSLNVVDSPENLAEFIAWSDLAVSASGLTKYELAALHTPSLQISLNRLHATVGKAFSDTGAAWHLGIARHLSVQDIGLSLEKAIRSHEIRKRMHEACKKLVDGNGAGRILDQINKMVC